MAQYLAEELDSPTAVFCRRWLAACAAYPLLRWPITTALGQALALADGQAPPDEAAHLALGRLPWFRQGRMPYVVRLALVRTLDRRDRRIVREALTSVMGDALDQAPQVRSKRGRRADSRRIANLIEDLPDDALQTDPLLPIVLRGGRPNPISLAYQSWRARLPRRMRPWLRPARLGWSLAFIAALAGGVAARPYLDRVFVSAEPRKSEALRVVRVVVSACGAPAGASGTIEARAVPGVLMAQSASMTPLDLLHPPGGEAFAVILVQRDLGLVLTQQLGQVGRLWGRGGGSIALQGPPVMLTSFEVVRSGAAEFLVGRDANQVAWGWALPSGKRLEGPLPDSKVTVTWIRPPADRSKVDQLSIDVASQASIAATPAYARSGLSPGDFVVTRGGARFNLGPITSPLVGVSALVGGGLAVLTCDPQGRVSVPSSRREGGKGAGETSKTGASGSLGTRYGLVYPPPPPPRPNMSLVRTMIVYFAFDQTILLAEGRTIVDEAARSAQRISGSAIVVAGHTDATHTREYALALGSREADAVREALLADGVPASDVGTISYGKDRPQFVYRAAKTAVVDPRDRRAVIYIYAPAEGPKGSMDPEASGSDVVRPTEVSPSEVSPSTPSAAASEVLIEGLSPDAGALARQLISQAARQGIELRVFSGYRTRAEQAELYAKGRTKPGGVVTSAPLSVHNTGKAFDVYILKNGTADWETAAFLPVGQIGQKLGLVWGGAWAGVKDYPHFETKDARQAFQALQKAPQAQ